MAFGPDAGGGGGGVGGGAAQGTAMGTAIMPGWGTLIGAAVGAIAGGVAGGAAKRKKRALLQHYASLARNSDNGAQSAVDEAKRGLAEDYGSIDAGLIDRGMYNTTVRDTLHSGATTNMARLIGQIRNQQVDRSTGILQEGYDRADAIDTSGSETAAQVGQLMNLALTRGPRQEGDANGTTPQNPPEPGGVGAQVSGDIQRQMAMAGGGGMPGGGGGGMGGRALAMARMYLNGRQPQLAGGG